ncbi:MAG: type IV toxin-antitoxin system AbiEi family antitoxin domain-containing protein [Victivallales bacterium]|nr:type IV toxin-antitoxin system AbiEi family antitoxin domain-containing protein [Victivallales bacterium]
MTEEILKFAEQNGGTVSSAQLKEAGIKRGCLKLLVDTGRLEKTRRGVYVLPGQWEDGFFAIQSQFKRGIFSGNTALYLWGLSDRSPLSYDMTFPASYNVSTAKSANINPVHASPQFYELGKTMTSTPAGQTVYLYNMERTLCDLLRKRSHADIQLVANAFKSYIASSKRNIMALTEMAHALHVDNKLQSYLEVLL